MLLLALLACQPDPRPDVILVTWDTVRADHIGAATPRFNALAAEGLTFSAARSPVPITLPSHATLMTGQYPHEHGTRENAGYTLAPEPPVLAERLSAAGWRSGAFVSAAVLEQRTGITRGFAHADDEIDKEQVGHHVPYRLGAETVDAALAWATAQPAEQPLFVWVHLFDAHRPWKPNTAAQARFPDDPYRAELSEVDAQTSRLLDGLAAHRGLDDALVVIAADHGEGLDEHGESTHAYFAYDSTLRIPLLFWWGAAHPGLGTRGTARPEAVTLADVAPTLLSVLGLPPLPASGLDLTQPVPPRDLPVECVMPTFEYNTAPVFGIIGADQQSWFDLPERELYNLRVDPGQRDNLYTSTHAAEADALFATVARDFDPGARQLADADTLARLQALGYLASAAPASGDLPDPKERVALHHLLSTNAKGMTQEEALRRGEEMLAEHGLLPALVLFLVDRLDSLGRFADAESLLSDAVAANPASENFPRELEVRRARRAQWRSQEAAIRAALAADPSHPTAPFDLALVLLFLEQLEEAEALLEGVVAAQPTDAEARINLSKIYGRRGAHAEALALVEVGRTGAHDPALDCQAGRLRYRYLGQPAEARADLIRCRDRGGRLPAADVEFLAQPG